MTEVGASRRTFVAGAALATAAAAAAPALGQEASKQLGAPTAPAAADYPKPPFRCSSSLGQVLPHR